VEETASRGAHRTNHFHLTQTAQTVVPLPIEKNRQIPLTSQEAEDIVSPKSTNQLPGDGNEQT
jgi:hypothetical protein